jgi:hypothetical protein
VERWVLNFHHLTPSEMMAIAEFHASHQGQFGSFAFTDPWTGVEYPDCSFENDEFLAEFISDTTLAAQLIIRNNQA